MSNTIHIEGVTPEQKEMLDTMWTIDSREEYLEWYETLDTLDQQQADLLQMMIFYECSDEVPNLDQARKVIEKVK